MNQNPNGVLQNFSVEPRWGSMPPIGKRSVRCATLGFVLKRLRRSESDLPHGNFHTVNRTSSNLGNERKRLGWRKKVQNTALLNANFRWESES
jgi:hypothetical protein